MSIKRILVPAEHWVWLSFIEAIVTGSLLAPALQGGVLAVGLGLAFMMGQAFRVRAFRWALGLGLLAHGFFILAYKIHPAPFMLGILCAVPLIVAQRVLAARVGPRSLAAETIGSVALGFPAASLMIAGGRPIGLAFAVWGLLAVRAGASVLYVRHKLRKERREDYSVFKVVGAHVAVFAVFLFLVWKHELPWLAASGYGLLALRALWGLLVSTSETPKQVGIREVCWGFANVVLIIFALR